MIVRHDPSGVSRGGFWGGGGGGDKSPLIWVNWKKMTEGKKAGGASKTKPSPLP